MIWRTLEAAKQQYSTDVEDAPVSRNLVVSYFCSAYRFNLMKSWCCSRGGT
jgi:hypothetical protein